MKHDNQTALNLLKTARGQIDAIIRMTEDDRYCVDIATQISAVSSLLKKANVSILQNHIETCVKDSLVDGSYDEKVTEIMGIIHKYI
jgi:DNA-binding FrmR family transcriptional regulator